MKAQDPSALLKEKILLLEAECVLQNGLLKDQFKLTVESLKPMNVIKDMFVSAIKNNVVDSAIGMTSGYLAKKTIVRSSSNPFIKILGSMVGIGVANFMAKHPDGIKNIGAKLLNSFFKKESVGTEGEDDH